METRGLYLKLGLDLRRQHHESLIVTFATRRQAPWLQTLILRALHLRHSLTFTYP
jgi:hypothetical protein